MTGRVRHQTHRIAQMEKYALRSSELHGIGLFADQTSINAGEKISVEAPILKMPTSQDQQSLSSAVVNLCDQLQMLGRKDINRIRLIALRDGDISNISQQDFAQGLQNRSIDIQEAAMAVFYPKGIFFSTWSKDQMLGMFNEIDLVNHSCTPNAERYWNEIEQQMELRATVAINHGDEVLISYIDPHQSRDKRNSTLGFECKCSACSLRGFVLSTYEQKVEILQRSFATLREFQLQYLCNSEFDEASNGLIVAIARDHTVNDAVAAAKNTIEISTQKFGRNSLKLARSFRVMYVVLACKATLERDLGAAYRSAYKWKVFELEVLAKCRGLKYPTARDVLRQLLDHAIQSVLFGHDNVVVALLDLLESCNSSLEQVDDGHGGVQLKASIRDGQDDEEEEIRSTPRYYQLKD